MSYVIHKAIYVYNPGVASVNSGNPQIKTIRTVRTILVMGGIWEIHNFDVEDKK